MPRRVKTLHDTAPASTDRILSWLVAGEFAPPSSVVENCPPVDVWKSDPAKTYAPLVVVIAPPVSVVRYASEEHCTESF